MNQDKDAPLREDIRLLGRLLGDTVRDQQGAAAFELIERIRQNSVRFHRDDDAAARRELEDILDALSRDQTIQVVRAFSYFSHLANIAEDQHHIRRSRAHLIAGSAPREGSLAHAVASVLDSGAADAAGLAEFFDTALVSPVLTAHPTEVQRKSILNCETVIARLLDERDRMQLTPEETEASLEALRRAVLTLWQTRMLRTAKLSVIDEVTNGLSYFDTTFLHELPRLYASLEDRLAAASPGLDGVELAAFLQVGSWIGGDRDGNPFVTAEVLDKALSMQATVVLDHYLDQLHRLGSQLSMSHGFAGASTRCWRWPNARRTTRRTAATNPIAWPCRASTPGWPPAIAHCWAMSPPATPSPKPRRMPMRRNWPTISTSCTARCSPTAPLRSPAAACASCAAQ